ncbi:M20 family metallopeptidase [Prauserella cavernicola]|uniref:Peptidase dimerization domain-containing protein n=1 Tax=Prauserella cavernicola TaxID=2800127 RepID=A0A934QYB7_9PSEU|nr:peptidase dimerization domain-containing protein [Prauserella cavernicola]MBK1787529.1 peptidase dimerization domain-containing protein [Prauserella cavernicola]
MISETPDTSELDDERYRLAALRRLCRIPSAVPLGPDTLIGPDDPIITEYLRRGPRREFAELGVTGLVELPMNQFAVRFGDGDGPGLAVMAYTPTQHNNLMADPWSGDVRTPHAHGVDEPCVFGQGVSQNKAPQVALLDLARWILEHRPRIRGTLWLMINNEGRSSHACSTAALEALPELPDNVLQLFPTGFQSSVGNRGRVDVTVHIRGRAVHSSRAPRDGRVIDTAAEFVTRLRALDLELRTNVHHRLGGEQAVVYQQTFDPVAPHTLPASATLVVDRRLLPGTAVDAAVDQIRRIAATLDGPDCELVVEPGVVMDPVLLEGRPPVLDALREAGEEHLGQAPPETVYGGSFDAGGPVRLGIPTVMFGLPAEGDLLGDDFVRVSAVHRQSRVLRSAVRRYFA